MKTEKDKAKALGMFINNIPMAKIGKEVGTTERTIIKWKDKYGWIEKREQTINQGTAKVQDKFNELIEKHVDVGKLALSELLRRLQVKKIKMSDKDLVQVIKHQLDVLRPRQTTQNNFINSKTINVTEELVRLVREVKNGEGI